MQSVAVTLFVFLLVLALGTWYVQVYRRRPKPYDDSPSYLKRDSLLMEHEQKYFETLTKVVGSHARVFPKVRLSDLVQPQGVLPEQRQHWLRVQRRCVDFLLCSPSNLSPVLAIDLDTRAKKRRRQHSPGNEVLDSALKTANIPLLRIRASREYDDHEVLHQIRFALSSSQEPLSEWFADQVKEPPVWWQWLESSVPTFSRWTSGLWGVLRRA